MPPLSAMNVFHSYLDENYSKFHAVWSSVKLENTASTTYKPSFLVFIFWCVISLYISFFVAPCLNFTSTVLSFFFLRWLWRLSPIKWAPAKGDQTRIPPFPHPHQPRRGHPDINHVLSSFFFIHGKCIKYIALLPWWRRTFSNKNGGKRWYFSQVMVVPRSGRLYIQSAIFYHLQRQAMANQIDIRRISSPISRIPHSRRPARLPKPSQP